MAELLKDEQLEDVVGGNGGTSSTDNAKFDIALIGPYWETSYQEGQAYTAAIGWPDLKAELRYPTRKCPYLITRYGEPIGWTIATNFTRLG